MKHGWSLEKEEWGEMLQLMSDTSWKKARLIPLETSDVPDCAGVYAICISLSECGVNELRSLKLCNPIYIGKAGTSLRNRFLAHCNTPSPSLSKAKECFNNLNFWYTILNVNDEDDIKRLEALMIKCFGPIVNQRQPQLRGIVGQPVVP